MSLNVLSLTGNSEIHNPFHLKLIKRKPFLQKLIYEGLALLFLSAFFPPLLWLSWCAASGISGFSAKEMKGVK